MHLQTNDKTCFMSFLGSEAGSILLLLLTVTVMQNMCDAHRGNIDQEFKTMNGSCQTQTIASNKNYRVVAASIRKSSMWPKVYLHYVTISKGVPILMALHMDSNSVSSAKDSTYHKLRSTSTNKVWSMMWNRARAVCVCTS